ncbi:MAG: hypothetical protein H6Q31_965 [Bacteroidetes bacterium]|nr:hypothetical protein [Bacteroidota bacterium]
MKCSIGTPYTRTLLSVLTVLILSTTSGAAQMDNPRNAFPTSTILLEAFKNPPASYRSTPFWVWNDRMTPELVDEGLADLHRHGAGAVFIHPRPGLITPYLSEEWLSLCDHAVKSAKRLGMQVWLYDENSYPSGFAGGHVPANLPDAKRTGLKMTSATELPPSFPVEPLVVLAKDSAGFSDITPHLKTRTFGPGEYRIFTRIYDRPSPWHGGFTYVDLLRPEVTREFINVTMGAYERLLGEEFGRAIPGVFQDEAEIHPPSDPGAQVVTYTPALFDAFRTKWRYDLKTALPSLFEETGEWRTVRHDFFTTVLELFIKGWAKPYFEYCETHNLKLTGHYWEHEWPRPVMNPDNMACAAYAQMPGIDVLMNEFKMETHAQFGNARIVKEIRSVANQMGYERTLSETYGASGWDLSFADQKRIGDWEYALGVNFLNQHLNYVSIKGARKRDHPPSFSYHAPWWDHYNILADYFGRLSVALCAGEQINRILLLEPTTTAWMYSRPQWKNSPVDTIGTTFQNFVNTLESAQVEYDLGSEDILRNHGTVLQKHLVVGRRAYDLIILPPGMENLDDPTVVLLQTYLKNGGNVICYGNPPEYVDGRRSDRVLALSTEFSGTWTQCLDDETIAAVNRLSPPVMTFRDNRGTASSVPLVFHHRRVLDDCQILFVANTRTEQYEGEILAPGQSCDTWDLFTGSSAPYPCVAEKQQIRIRVSIPPSGSMLLCLRNTARTVSAVRSVHMTDIPSSGETIVKRLAPNVLTVDYCDLALNGKTERDLYFYQAQQKAFGRHGLERNPWDGAVQFKSTILEKDTFATESGFDATFHCVVAEGVDRKSLRAVVEQPELFRVTVNGKSVTTQKGAWWLDKDFGLFDIGKSVASGDNRITVASSPFTVHSELEPVYILGNFSLEPWERGFRVVPESALRLGAWNEQGLPFYANVVGYTRTFDLTGKQVKSGRFAVRLGKWNGTMATVSVNGRDAGVIAFPPYELDVTKALKPGKNSICINVSGSLKNTLGPHHNNPSLGRAWPSQFQQGATEGVAAGREYSTVGYGLFEDFTLLKYVSE